MATSTYTPLAETTLAAGSTEVLFTSISQDYTDLVLVVAGTKATSGVAGLRVQANADTGSNYHVISMEGGGSSYSRTISSPNDYIEGSNNRTFSSVSVASAAVEILGYSSSNNEKVTIARSSRADGTESQTYASVSRWASGSPITSLRVYISSGEFDTGSTFKLFGIHGEV